MRRKFLLIILIVFSFLFSACGLRNNSQDLGLTSIKSLAELKEKLQKTYQSDYRIFGSNDFMLDKAAPEVSTEAKGEKDYTKTNIQVDGVDEGDVIKTDGSRIYSIYHDRLRVIEVNQGNMEVILEKTINEVSPENSYYTYRYFTDLYLTDKYFVALYMDYRYIQTTDEEPMIYYRSYKAITCITIYDIESLEIVKEYEISGSIITSRLIDNQLYVVAMHHSYYEEADPRPWYDVDGVSKYVDLDRIKYIENTENNTFTIIARINLQKTPQFDYDCLLSPYYWQQVYVSKKAMYFTTYQYFPNLFGLYDVRSLLVSYIFDTDGSVYYGGSGLFDGYVIDQFSMDEYDGYMRLVTTDNWGDKAINRLFVFKREVINGKYELVVVGKIDKGLGKPGEKVKSARFNGLQATVVTFLQIDPLYVIDLKDPTKPVIVGQLEMPGYSTYQHPWEDGLVLGLGYQTVDARITGLKISLFDISNPTQPQEVGSPLVIDSSNWAYSEALYNHKALLIDKTRNIIGFSIMKINWSYYEYSSLNEYLLFSIDKTSANPISITKVINHYELAGSPKITNDYSFYFWNNSYELQRAVRIGDYLYAISGSLISAHNLSDEASQTKILVFN